MLSVENHRHIEINSVMQITVTVVKKKGPPFKERI